MQRKPQKKDLIYKAKRYIEKYRQNADITEVLIEYYDMIMEVYKLFEEKAGYKIGYLGQKNEYNSLYINQTKSKRPASKSQEVFKKKQ